MYIHLSKYEDDFTFIVNGEKFPTSRLFAELLSPKISDLRIQDPTICEYHINTKTKGNFNGILELKNFNLIQMKTFILEILAELGTTSRDVYIESNKEEISIDNVINRISMHENKEIFAKNYNEEIEFVSSHFTEMNEKKKSEMKKLSNYSLWNIINNEHLTISNEDELVLFINEAYLESSENSNLYEFVLFTNVDSNTMKKFVEVVKFEDITGGIWESISSRLVEEVTNKEEQIKLHEARYKSKFKAQEQPKQSVFKEIQYSNKGFEGIINYFKRNSDIKNEIDITYSSDNCGGLNKPFDLIEYENGSKHFTTRNEENSWICIEFKNHKIIPTNYTIRSNECSQGFFHPLSWVIEGSNDKIEWNKLGEERNNRVLDGKNVVHTFPIQNKQEIKYIRFRQIGPNSHNDHYLYISAIEIYGQII